MSTKVVSLFCLTFGAAASMTSCALAAAPGAPTGLLTNGIANPQAIDKVSPGFSWIMRDADRGERQTAWQIRVSTTSDNKGDVWDSGKVTSANSSSVVYSGPALAPATRYWWRIKLWDKDGNSSPFSAPATFEVGLDKTDWAADYIWDGTTNQNNFAFFRKGFTLGKRVKRAQVFASAHNDFILFLNGRQLGFGPARSNPTTYGQYVGFDVTRQLAQGANAFAAQGHWQGTWNDSGVNAEPAFLLECHIDFIDGTKMIVKSDGTWKTLAQTPFIEASPTYFGQAGGVNNRAAIRYDARQEVADWKLASFDDSKWLAASVVERPKFSLYAQRVADQVEETELAPVALRRSNSSWSADFGKCLSGWPQVTFHDQTPGTVVRISYFQLADGAKEAGWDEYTCKGGTETWTANFGRHTSFKVLRISGLRGPLNASDVRGIVSHTGADVAGSFTCSNALLNQIYAMSERSARQNVQQGIISVDANREQSPWTADSYLIGQGLLYNHRNTQILDKVIRDYAGEQMTDGRFWACSPAGVFEIPEWSMYWPMMLRQQYLFSGDKALVAQMYPHLQKWLAQCALHQKDTGLVDMPGWRIADYAGGVMENDGQNVALNSLYYENLRIAAQFASLLGYTEEASTYSVRAADLKAAINANLFVDGQCYLTKVGSQQRLPLGAAYALRFDIVPDAARSAVTAWIRTQPIHLGGYGGETFYSGAFHAGGLGDLIVADLIRYQSMLKGNATIWESFSRYLDNEANHAWTSYPAYLFQRYIGGVQPTGPGFSTFSIAPEIRGLSFAQATVPTVKGDIKTRWQVISPTEIALNCTVPPNSSALVHIPISTLKNASIAEGKATLWKNGVLGAAVPNIAYAGADARFARFTVGSGTYSFRVTGMPVSLPGTTVIVDNDIPGTQFTGAWANNRANEIEQRYDASVDIANAGDGGSRADFCPNLPSAGIYNVYARWTSHPNRATNAAYTVHHLKGVTAVTMNQQLNGGQWNLLGTFNFNSGTGGFVTLTNAANGYVIADAIKFEPVA